MESSYRWCSKATGCASSRFLGACALPLFLALVLALIGGPGCGGEWTGSVGAVFGKDNQSGRVYVREAPSDMPAAQAGVMIDDEVVAIDGKPVRGMSADDVHKALAGKVGTKVRLEVRRGGEVHEVVIERGPLKGSAAESRKL